jgi:prepilin-type N-terminal cleavage/methylation domain-containing protein
VDHLNPRRGSGRARAGFTLIELMITLTVLGTGLLAMLVLQTQALADGARGKHTSGAAMVARDQLERIQLTPSATTTCSRSPGRPRPGSTTPAIRSWARGRSRCAWRNPAAP